MAGALRTSIRTILSPLADEQLAQRYAVAVLAAGLAIILRCCWNPFWAT